MNITEGGSIFLSDRAVSRSDSKCDGMSLSVELAHEFMPATTRHTIHLDVIYEFHGFAAETVVGSIVLHCIAEHVPTGGRTDKVRVVAVVGKIGQTQRFIVGEPNTIASVDVGAVGEALTALDVHSTVIFADADEVGGFAQADGDGEPDFKAVVDAIAATGGGDLPAVNDEV